MAQIKHPVLPPLLFQKVGNYTYARTYDNAWVASKKDSSKKHAIKCNLKTVGKIFNNSGTGEVVFTDEFYARFPTLKHFKITRELSNLPHKKYQLTFEQVSTATSPDKGTNLELKYIGPAMLFDSLLANDPLVSALKAVFDDNYSEILSLAYYLALDDKAQVSDFKYFAQDTLLPCNVPLENKDLDYLFVSISKTHVQDFFMHYLKALSKKGLLTNKGLYVIDTTTKSSYVKPSVDNDNIELNSLLVVDKKSYRPLFYEIFNGSIPDISSCKDLLCKYTKQELSLATIVADSSFCSDKNLVALNESKAHFAFCFTGKVLNSYQGFIDEAKEAMRDDNYYVKNFEQSIYTCKGQTQVTIDESKKSDAYVHVFYDVECAGSQVKAYQQRLYNIKELYLDGASLTVESSKFLEDNFKQDKEGHFIVKKGSLILDMDSYQAFLSRAGVSIMIADAIDDATVACKLFMTRKAFMDSFASFKERMNVKDFATGAESFLLGKSFVMFIAFTLRTLLEEQYLQAKQEGTVQTHDSLEDIIADIKGIMQVYITHTNSYIIKSLTANEVGSLAVFGLKPPFRQYVCKFAVDD